jgi:hypothetical protein
MVRDDDAGQVKRWRELFSSERDAATLYARIAATTSPHSRPGEMSCRR